MTDNEIKLLRKINEKLDRLQSMVPLLRILAKANIDKAKNSTLTTSTRKEIFEYCDGKMDVQEIAKKAKTTTRYVNLLIAELEDAGLVVVEKKGARRYPRRTI